MAEICETCGLPEAAHEMDPCARAALQARATPDAEIARLRAEVARLTWEVKDARSEARNAKAGEQGALEAESDTIEDLRDWLNSTRAERDALRACVTQLVGALRGVSRGVQAEYADCWCVTIRVKNTAPHERRCVQARAALAAAEKLGA